MFTYLILVGLFFNPNRNIQSVYMNVNLPVSADGPHEMWHGGQLFKLESQVRELSPHRTRGRKAKNSTLVIYGVKIRTRHFGLSACENSRRTAISEGRRMTIDHRTERF